MGCELRDEALGRGGISYGKIASSVWLECDPRQSGFVVARLRQTACKVLSFAGARPRTATSAPDSPLLWAGRVLSRRAWWLSAHV